MSVDPQRGVSRFAGQWEMDPTQSAYELGEPPAAASYGIRYDGERLYFTMVWTNSGGDVRTQHVEAIPDGQDHRYLDNPAFADTIAYSFTYTLFDEATLDSTAKRQGIVVGRARRVLSPDGATMTITQSGPGPGGKDYTNVAVYRRVDGA